MLLFGAQCVYVCGCVCVQVKGRRAESDSGSPGGSSLQLNAGRKISTSLQHFHRPGTLYPQPTVPPTHTNPHIHLHKSRTGG